MERTQVEIGTLNRKERPKGPMRPESGVGGWIGVRDAAFSARSSFSVSVSWALRPPGASSSPTAVCTPMPALEASDLARRFGRRVLFRRLSFVLEGGRSLAITGSNGAGKSTLLKVLAGVLRPSKGTVSLSVDGRTLPDDLRPLHTGLVAPYLNVYDGFTARENLAFLARARRLQDSRDRIARALELVSLTPRADDLVSTYSSGMKQRVKYAAAVLAAPSLLLLDEPSSNLDEAGIAMVDAVTAHQRATGGLLVVATNMASEASRCDDILRIEDFL